jgi:GxxExxY protein
MREEDGTDPQTEAIIAAAIEVHRHLGPGLLESIYEEALCHELALRSMPFEQQKSVVVVYKGKAIKGQRIDLVVFGEVVVDVKSVRAPHEYWRAQLLSYLKSTGLTRGLIINFGMPRLVEGVQRFSL